MRLIDKAAFILLLILFYCCSQSTAAAQGLAAKADHAILTAYKDKTGPGGVFMVAKNGKMIYQKAIGKANLELNVDLTAESVFQLGSMTKQFTAIAVLMLQEQGKLDVQQAVSKYIPDYPSGDSITLHHLLTHTSGIKDFTKMKALKDIAQKEMTPEMLVGFFKNEPPDFKPGEQFEYNNSGYVLLGHIIELVSGESYEGYIKKHIFEKAGMSRSAYATDRQIIHKRAYGYQKKDSGYVNKTAINYSIPFAAGSLMSTVNDMLKWQNALTQDILLAKETSKKAFAKYKLNSGEEFTYGYGWHIKEINGVHVREHGGSIFGFKTMGVYIPAEDIYVIGLSNCDCNSPTQLVRDIAAMALKMCKKSKPDNSKVSVVR
jgi:CubicO group peptidase (beta-lactamase class C family)